MCNSVLIVDDDLPILRLVTRMVEKKCPDIRTIRCASNIESAKRIFSDHAENFKVIVVDGHISETLDDTENLVRFFRESGFNRTIIVQSSDPGAIQVLIAAGCNRSILKPNISPLIGLINNAP